MFPPCVPIRAMNLSETRSRPSGKTLAASVAGVIGLVIFLSSLLLVSPTHSAGGSQSASYAVDGLTCSLPQGTPANIALLVQKVVQAPSFVSETGGVPYVFQTFGNMTNHVVTIGQATTTTGSSGNASIQLRTIGTVTTIRLPDAVGLEFASWGPNTSCSESGISFLHWMDVQVPVQDGQYDLGNLTVHVMGGHK